MTATDKTTLVVVFMEFYFRVGMRNQVLNQSNQRGSVAENAFAVGFVKELAPERSAMRFSFKRDWMCRAWIKPRLRLVRGWVCVLTGEI
jgi:hypothetical protein